MVHPWAPPTSKPLKLNSDSTPKRWVSERIIGNYLFLLLWQYCIISIYYFYYFLLFFNFYNFYYVIYLIVQSFAVPSAVQAHYNQSVARASAAQIQWEQMFQLYAAQHPKLASDFQRRMRGELPPDEEWVNKLPGNPAVRFILKFLLLLFYYYFFISYFFL